MLLNALNDVKHLSWKVDIIGGMSNGDYSTKCKKRAIELGIDDRVTFLGTRLDIVEILTKADFALLASKTESGPLALIEYAAAGLPFISTRVGLVGKQMANRGVKEFVEPGNAQQFAQALAQMLVRTSSEREQQGLFGQRVAQELFDIKAVLPQWYAVYKKALRLRQ
jgi:glycosyltransferase involved in cell wall biosynthesis